jgi:hypothetical protein
MTKDRFAIRTAVIISIIFLVIFIARDLTCAADHISLRTAQNGEDIRKIFKVISMQAGINLLIDKSVSGKIYTEFMDLHYKEALQKVAAQKKLSVTEEGNIYIISAQNKTPDIIKDKLPPAAANDDNAYANALSKPEFNFISVCADGEDIRLVFKTLAINAGKEIFYDDSTRGKVAFNLKNAGFESAVRAIASVNGLSVKKENGKYYIGTAANLSGTIDSNIFSTDYPGLGKNIVVPQTATPMANPAAPPAANPGAPPMPFKATVTVGGMQRNSALISMNPLSMIVSDDDDAGVIGVIKVVEIKENSVKIIDCQSNKERILTMKR